MPKHFLQPQTLYRPTSNPESQCPDACSSVFPRSPKGMCQCWRSFYTFNPVLMMASVVQKVKYCVTSPNNNKQTKPTKPNPPSKKPKEILIGCSMGMSWILAHVFSNLFLIATYRCRESHTSDEETEPQRNRAVSSNHRTYK